MAVNKKKRNRNAGKSTGKSRSSKYYAKSPASRKKKNAYNKKYNAKKREKKKRAELNRYNHKKGTYGNGDGKDASHKNGKIVGMEKASSNRKRNGKGSTHRGRKKSTRKTTRKRK